MMEQPASKWILGRSRQCDVVVDALGVETTHCELSRDNESWSISPIDGSVGIRQSDQEPIQWFSKRRSVSATDSLWLTKDLKFPWPVESDAKASLTVGRAIDSDIVMPSTRVSGRHALLIVGHHGTWVLRDHESRNGLFIDEDLQQRVAAVMLLPGRNVFFGSERITANELVAKAKLACGAIMPPAQPAQQPLPPIDSTLTQIRLKARQPKSIAKPIITVLSAIIPSIVAFAIWWVWMRPIPNPQPMEPPIAHERAQSTLIASEAVPLVVEPTPVEPVVKRSDPGDAMYWVVVRHNDSGNYFRLGSAVGVSADTLLTTASVVTSIDQMAADGYSDPSIAHVATGQISQIVSHQVFPEFVKRTQAATAMIAQYESLVKKIGDDAN